VSDDNNNSMKPPAGRTAATRPARLPHFHPRHRHQNDASIMLRSSAFANAQPSPT
jgi:hypothetical protein